MKERKLYQCKHPICTREQAILSRGLCNFHRYMERVEKNEIKIKISKNKRDRKDILAVYYQYHLEKIRKNPYCENCGGYINSGICNIAHILPKQNTIHPEVLDELNNCLHLCSSFDNTGRDCHSRYDKCQASSRVYLMPVWELAVEKYLTFKHKCRYTKYTKIFEDWIEENE